MFSALGCHIFAGGFTLGVQELFDVRGQVESGYGEATFRRNFPHIWVTRPDSLRQPLHGAVDFVYGNPPCAPWSSNRADSKRVDWTEHAGMQMSFEHARLIGELRPLVWAQESVSEMATRGIDHVRSIAREARELGYQTTLLFHDGKFLGLPQQRRRVMMFCHKVELVLDPPAAEAPTRTVREALLGAERWGQRETPQGWAEIIHRCPPLTRPRQWCQREGVSMPDRIFRPTDIVLDPDWYAPTQLGYDPPCALHWEGRVLSVAELGRLSGWPDDFDWGWPRGRSAVSDEMCRAVLPPTARWVAGRVHESLEVAEPAKPRSGIRVVYHTALSGKLRDAKMVVREEQWPI